MRPFALAVILLSFITFILSFLCIFAGDKPKFMPTYYIISLNTSRAGENLIAAAGGGGALSSLLGGIEGDINSLIGDLAHDIGIADFYNLHTLDYCEGTYTPTAVPNSTVSAHDIHENVTYCSPHTKRYTPGQALQADLTKAGTGITLSELDWPDEIDTEFNKLYDALDAVIACYALAILFSFITILFALYWFLRDAGRCAIILTVLWATLSFLFVGIASGAMTGIMVEGVRIINKYVETIGVEALRGHRFLAITWAATVCAFIAMIVSFFGICCGAGHRRDRVKRVSV